MRVSLQLKSFLNDFKIQIQRQIITDIKPKIISRNPTFRRVNPVKILDLKIRAPLHSPGTLSLLFIDTETETHKRKEKTKH